MTPVPSRSDLDLDRRLLGRTGHTGGSPVEGGRIGGGCAHRRLSVSAARNRSFSSGRPTVTRRHPVSPGHVEQSRTSTTGRHEIGPDRRRVPGGRPEQQEVGVGGPRLDRQPGEGGGDPAPLLGDGGHPRVHLVRVLQCQAAGELGHGVQVVGQGDQLARGHDLGVGHEVAEARPGHRPRLGEGAHDHHVAGARRVRRPERQGRRRGELAVGLVHHQQPGHQARHRGDLPGGVRPPRRVVGRAEERDHRIRPGHHPGHGVEVEAEVVPAPAGGDGRTGDPGDVAVQRVGRLEQRGRPTGPPVGQQEALEDLVRAVGTEHLVDADPVAVGQGPAQFGGLPVGVPVEVDLGHGRGQRLLPRRRAAAAATRWC